MNVKDLKITMKALGFDSQKEEIKRHIHEMNKAN